jgi:FkbM family methyltransferase
MTAEFLNYFRHWLLDSPRAMLFVSQLYGRHFGLKISLKQEKAWIVRKATTTDEIWLSIRHSAYLRDVIRDFDYYFSSVEPQAIDGRQIVDCTEPRMQRLNGMDQAILITGLPEPTETNQTYVSALELPLGGVVLDVGSYCGASSLLFAKTVGPNGIVIAIEPDPQNFAALEQNTISMPTIRTIRAALWPQSGTVQFGGEGNMGSAVNPHRKGNGFITVQAITPTALIEKFSLKRVDGIKLDIEGSEYEVIPALREIFLKFRPRLIFELHPSSPAKKKALFDSLTVIGYRLKFLQQSNSDLLPLIVGIPS